MDTEHNFFVHASSYIDEGVEIGEGTKIWHFSHVLSGAKIGKNCSFGQNTSIAGNVVIGNNVKVQNNVSIYEGLTIEDDVFLGPSAVLTNVSNPRSQVTRNNLYEKTRLRKGCSIGANATVVCGITIGRYAFIGAGAVITKDVPDYAFMLGIPAKQTGWISRHGHPLKFEEGSVRTTCPESGFEYQLNTTKNTLHCTSINEEANLPEDQSTGNQSYRSFK